MSAFSISPKISPKLNASQERNFTDRRLSTNDMIFLPLRVGSGYYTEFLANRGSLRTSGLWQSLTGTFRYPGYETFLRSARFSSNWRRTICALDGAVFRGERRMSNIESPLQNPQLLTERQAADWLRHSLPTLRRWRRAGNGPRFVRFGRLILYRLEDLDAFLVTHLSNPEVA
jgi:helix-turn-helix protein